MKKSLNSVLVLTIALLIVFSGQTLADEKASVSLVLDELHKAASEHKADKYFSLFTADAIFLGTDATERWDMDAMKKWAIPYFNSGKGWTYTKIDRFIYLSADKKTAWFDETLNNEKYLDCRGSGALIKVDGKWKIAQYNLTFPIPNEIALAVIEMKKAAINIKGAK